MPVYLCYMSYNEVPYQTELTVLALRLITGTLFFIQGYDKVFNIGIAGVYQTFHEPMHKKNIPAWCLKSSAWFTSLAELVCGAMLIAGLFTPWAGLVLLLDLLLVVIAFGILEPMWDVKHVFPRLVLLTIVLMVPSETHLFSLDYLLIN